ncbi:hypothetical protein AC578_8979 [Pseudocercospora eumusae]|uniref:C2H2-type domain-containing protein n=1 Tax=Pseudocercospora eumusae TaxID=321146 RepID=A0A139HAB3_9PEZI|nr:hypothetical protein AC578_8979 [Pseudocercospora eumusae]
MDMRFADTSQSACALTRSNSSDNHRSETATIMETRYIEPNWKDAQRVARMPRPYRKRLNRLRNTAVFRDIQTNINAAAGVRQEDRLAQDEQKRGRMREMIQAQALKDGPLPEDEQTRSLEQLSPEDKKAYRVAQRRDAVLDMNPAYANISNKHLSTLTKRIDNDVGMSKIILPQFGEIEPCEEFNHPREGLKWTSDAVEPIPGSRYECLQALFQDDSLVDSRLQLRSRGAVEDPHAPSSTSSGSQNGGTSRRRSFGKRTEVDVNDNNAFGRSKEYELPEPIEDEFLRLPPSVQNKNGLPSTCGAEEQRRLTRWSVENKDGLPSTCGHEEQRRLARWKALREASATISALISALDQEMPLSNARSEPAEKPDDTEQSDTLSADDSSTHERLGSGHATEDDSDKESSVPISKRSRTTQPSIKLRIDLRKSRGRALPKQSSDGSHAGFQCSICGNSYTDKNGLRRHTKKIHSEQARESQRSVASAEFEHGRTRGSVAPVGSSKREQSTTLSNKVSADLAVDDKAKAATSSSATKPETETSAPSPRKRSASDPGGQKELRKAIVNTRNNSEL